jgi:thymidine kinase
MAIIQIYTGPMASGKTSKMLDQLHKYSNVTKERVLLVLFKGDTRSSGISTHMYGDSSKKIPIGKYIDTIMVDKLEDIISISGYNIIGIDEAQFFTDLEEFVRRNSIYEKYTFHISGLSFDSNNKPFGYLMNLLDIATTFEKMTAICSRCDPRIMSPAGFTFAEVPKESVVKIGGLDMYRPLCYKHFLEAKLAD